MAHNISSLKCYKLCRIYNSCLSLAHRLSVLLHTVTSISYYNVIPLYTKKPVHFNAILLAGMLSYLSAFLLDILFDLNCLERRQEETWNRALSFHSDLVLLCQSCIPTRSYRTCEAQYDFLFSRLPYLIGLVVEH